MWRFLQILSLLLLASCAGEGGRLLPSAPAPLPEAGNHRLILCRNLDYPWPWDSLQPWATSQEILVAIATRSWGLQESQIRRFDGDPSHCLNDLEGFDGPLLIALSGHVLESGELLLPDRRRIALSSWIEGLATRRGPTWLLLDNCHSGRFQAPAHSQVRILSVCGRDELSRELRLSANRLPTLRRLYAPGRQWIEERFDARSVSPLGLVLAQVETQGWPKGGLDAKLQALTTEAHRFNSLPGLGNQRFDLRGIPPSTTGR
ncbi:MAG: hypothetical protein RL095_256 [Verrucomicrobiota bacterium]